MENKETHFQIYGRSSYEQPLSFVAELVVEGSVTDEVLAEVGDEAWVELVAIPTAAMLHVIGGRGEGDDEE